MAVISRNPVGRVIGMGSARHGAGTWMKERLSGMALLPLGIWFVVWAVSLSDASYEEVRGMPDVEPVFRMTPPPWRFMCGTTCLAPR